MWSGPFSLFLSFADTVSREGQGSVSRGQELMLFQYMETGDRPKRTMNVLASKALQSPSLPLHILVSLIKNKQNALVKYSQ